MLTVKKKSLIVALVSSFVIALVMILTLIGYLIYVELKGEELRRSYQAIIQKANARAYAKYIEMKDLAAEVEKTGALKGNVVIKGVITNTGDRTIKSLILKITFVDPEGAGIYAVTVYPQEPPLGVAALTRVSLPYLGSLSGKPIVPRRNLPFKTIITACPPEIIRELRDPSGTAKTAGRWSGRLEAETIAVDF